MSTEFLKDNYNTNMIVFYNVRVHNIKILYARHKRDDIIIHTVHWYHFFRMNKPFEVFFMLSAHNTFGNLHTFIKESHEIGTEVSKKNQSFAHRKFYQNGCDIGSVIVNK